MRNLLEQLLQTVQINPKQGGVTELPSGLMAMLLNNQTPDSSQPHPMQLPEQRSSGIGHALIERMFNKQDQTAAKDYMDAEPAGQGIPLRPENMTSATGVTGGPLDTMSQVKYLSNSPDPFQRQTGTNLMADIIKAKSVAAKPDIKLFEAGLEGDPSMRQQMMLDAMSGQLSPIGAPWKPQSGVTVNTGDGTQMVPATVADKESYGLDPRIPATKNRKTGEVTQHPQTGITEDMRKSAQYYRGLVQSNSKLESMLSDPSYNATRPPMQDFAGSVAKATGIPIISDIGNTAQSPQAQMLDQAKNQFKVNAIHTLTGAGYSEKEAIDKVEAYLPSRYGDTPEVTKWKMEGRQSIIDGTFDRAGSAIPSETKATQTSQKMNGVIEGHTYTDSGTLPNGKAWYMIDGKKMTME